MYEIDKNVYAYQCPECGQLHYPAAMRCTKCGYRRYPEEEVERYWKREGYKPWKKTPLGGPCKLLSYTRLWALPVGFDQRYLDFGLVEFENGLRASGQLLIDKSRPFAKERDKPKIGMRLNARVGKIKEFAGKEYYGLQFEEA